MKKKDRFAAIIDYFRENMPVAQTELHYENPFQLLIAVVLSAQCTDRRVNIVTPPLFRDYPDASSLGAASKEEILPYVKSVTYPNAKAEHIVALSKKLADDYNGEVPSDIDTLMSLPGVGRKSANVIASIVYDQPRIAVDTHVFRVAHRLGLSKGTTPLKVENDLEAGIPEEYRAISHHWLILHGRYICTARNPKCSECGLQDICPDFISRTVL